MLKIDLQFFGGRGSSSGGLPTAEPNGSGPRAGSGKFTNAPAYVPETLREALGKKGRPMSMENAVRGANPYYDGSYREFSENCQRAVVAYEARRRGYNVTAQPTFEGDVLPQGNVGGKGNGRWQGAFKGAKSESVGASNGDKVVSNIEKKMADYGDGSRAIVKIQWKNGDGHVFNVERKNGKTYYVDAQIGAKYNPKQLFSQVKPQSTRIVRTDNLKFSDRMKKSVEQSGVRTSAKKMDQVQKNKSDRKKK